MPEAPAWAEVASLLRARCLPCHGGDEVESGLRFATAATFRAGGFRGPEVDADALGESRLLRVVSYVDPELSMPPTGELPDEERELLERWVLSGAPWPEGPEGRLADPEREAKPAEHDRAELLDWWAYRPLVAPEVPGEGGVHPVDALLERRRAGAGLAAAPQAPPGTLLRRATFDLIGLPPTPAELADFEARIAARGFDAAWSEVIERLLASPHYGERWARHWLDLVRYAETNGYERDGTKTNAWRYRDWVIRVLNEDMPYDRFVLEQLAGDELEPPDPAARIATGYYRLGVWDDEPSDPMQADADGLADVVDTTGQVFLGTTMGCARCHDHKADPITQREYYGLTAFFRPILSYGGGTYAQHLGGGTTVPIPDAPGPGVLAPEERDARLGELEAELVTIAQGLGLPGPAPDAPPPAVLVGDARGRAATWRYHAGAPEARWETPAFDDAAWAEGPGGFGTAGTPGAIVGTTWDGAEVQLRTTFRLEEVPEDVVLSLHHDEDAVVSLNGVEVLRREGWRTDYEEVQLDAAARASLVVGRNVLAVACRQTSGGQYVDAGLRTGTVQPRDPNEWLARLWAHVQEHPDEPACARARELLHRRRRLRSAPTTEPYPALVVLEKGGVPEPQHVLQRGSAHAPGDEVAPHVPAALLFGATDDGPVVPPPSDDAATSGRRLALARWLVGGGAHVTARVLANRLWQHHFGRGLCRSPGDFGRLGELPTHPELIDHLACEVLARGWSLKAMHRYLMTSAAYRMSSVPGERALAADPNNDLYARFDARRLSAEEYRDAVLAVAGTLNPALFGPSVTPPLPQEVIATASRPDLAWGDSTPEEANRRSLYVFVKRSLRPPLMEGLDQPDPDLPCPARFPTNVPTQALMTMNGAFTAGAAESFARRLEAEAQEPEARIARGLELALGRPPLPGEVARHAAFAAALRESGADDHEALRLLCLGLYNLNEFLWVD